MKPRIAVVIGSTRPGRKGEGIGHWVHEVAAARDDLDVELVDVADRHLPLFDEPAPPMLGRYANDHTRVWAETIRAFDGFVFVVAEYNHGIPAALKNAVDYLYAEWNDKAAGFVGYGVDGGVRAIEQLRLVLAPLKVATVSATAPLRLFTDLGPDGRPADPRHAAAVSAVLDQVRDWSAALAPLRQPVAVAAS